MSQQTQVQMWAGNIGGPIETQNSGTVVPNTNGVITVSSLDVPSLLAAGCKFLAQTNATQYTNAPRAATAGRIVGSTSLANGTLSIANQPDCARQAQMIVAPGSPGITAGVLTLNYLANDGTTTSDALSVITAANTLLTTRTSKGMLHLNTAIVTGLTGGGTPGVQVDDTNSLSCMVPPNYNSFTPLLLTVDGTASGIAATAAAAASYTPSTAPNGTHNFGMSFSVEGALV